MRGRRSVAPALLAALLLAACCSCPPVPTAQESKAPTTPGFVSLQDLHVQIVRLSTEGDAAAGWLEGLTYETDRLRMDPNFIDAGGSEVRLEGGLESAIGAAPDAIVLDGGTTAAIQALISRAIDAEIPVVTNNVGPVDERASEVAVAEEEITGQLAAQLIADIGGEGQVICVCLGGGAAVERRVAAWDAVLAANPGISEMARVGEASEDPAASAAALTEAALEENPETVAVFAPFGPFAQGAAAAVVEAGLAEQVTVYGADVSDEIIAAMAAEGSPWAFTAAVDPYNLGAVTYRCAVIGAQDLDIDRLIILSPVLVTQERIRSGGITNMSGLRQAYLPLVATNTCTVAR